MSRLDMLLGGKIVGFDFADDELIMWVNTSDTTREQIHIFGKDLRVERFIPKPRTEVLYEDN